MEPRSFAKMKSMRLGMLCALFGALALAGPVVDAGATSVQGTLIQRENQKPVVETKDRKRITLEGDESTLHVLHDKRLAGVTLEAKGHFLAADRFQVEPFHTRALHVVKNGKRLAVTYWCDVCSIRSYEPGPCWCCQRETDLDLRELKE
jgi:hypothetical protein